MEAASNVCNLDGISKVVRAKMNTTSNHRVMEVDLVSPDQGASSADPVVYLAIDDTALKAHHHLRAFVQSVLPWAMKGKVSFKSARLSVASFQCYPWQA